MSKYIETYIVRHTFDSTIIHPGAVRLDELFEYFLVLRVHLRQVNPKNGKLTDTMKDYDGDARTIIPWDQASWLNFKTQYVKRVVQVWDKGFLLIPPASYDGFMWPAKGKRRDLLCRLKLVLEDARPRAHVKIRVVRLQNPTVHNFRSDAGTYSSDVVDPRTRHSSIDGSDILSNSAAHEVGHLLGLTKHINADDPQCKTNTEEICYGSTLAQEMNVMGKGSMLALKNARPWLRRIHRHAPPTHHSDWEVGWASAEAQMRGMGVKWIDEQGEKPKFPTYKPGLIDI